MDETRDLDDILHLVDKADRMLRDACDQIAKAEDHSKVVGCFKIERVLGKSYREASDVHQKIATLRATLETLQVTSGD